jgi:hypothetical protein
MADPQKTSPKDVTPDKYDGPYDTRKQQEAGEYPYYHIIRGGPDGGHITFDSTEGAESITIQGRGGETVQMAHGKIKITASDGMYTVVLGENRCVITGANDLVVHGDCSLRVKGTYRTTVEGDVEHTVHGNFNLTARNINTTARGNIDTVAKNVTTAVEGNMETSVNGLYSVGADAGLAFASTSGAVTMLGSKNVGIGTPGPFYVQSGSSMHLRSGAALNLKSTDKTSIKAATIATDATGQTLIQSGASVDADELKIAHDVPSAPATEPVST